MYGQDYMTVWPNGVGVYLVRSILLTNDGAKIAFVYEGQGGYKEAVVERNPNGVRIKCAPYMQTSHPGYLWINHLQCIEMGEVYGERVVVVLMSTHYFEAWYQQESLNKQTLQLWIMLLLELHRGGQRPQFGRVRPRRKESTAAA